MKKKDKLYQSESDWLRTGVFQVGHKSVRGNQIRYALAGVNDCAEADLLVTMVGGIPRDPNRRDVLPLINKLYGLLAVRFAGCRVSSLLYNQPATGGSSGNWDDETILSRSLTLAELMLTVGEEINVRRHVVIGTSAGAYMAVRALGEVIQGGHSVTSLVLQSPAVYPEELEIVPYGDRFTSLLRSGWDITTSPIFDRLNLFIDGGGRLRITFFEVDDPPIPKEIQKYFKRYVQGKSLDGVSFQYATINGVAHNFRSITKKPSDSAVDNDSIRLTASETMG